MESSADRGHVRLAELVAALSLGIDLGCSRAGARTRRSPSGS
jgi:hypothetical protein